MLEPVFFRQLAGISAAILEMAITVVVGIALGTFLDARLGSEPVLMLVLALGALVVGMMRLSKAIARLSEPKDQT